MSNIPIMKKDEFGSDSFLRRKQIRKLMHLIGRFPEFELSDRAKILRTSRYGNSAAGERLDLPKDVRADCWTPRPKLVQIPVQIRQGSGILAIARDSSIGT